MRSQFRCGELPFPYHARVTLLNRGVLRAAVVELSLAANVGARVSVPPSVSIRVRDAATRDEVSSWILSTPPKANVAPQRT